MTALAVVTGSTEAGTKHELLSSLALSGTKVAIGSGTSSEGIS